MTVGIYLTNGNSIVAITDSRRSGYGRQSDSSNKMFEFSRDNYFGVIFGSGLSNFIEGLYKNSEKVQGATLDDFVANMQQTLKGDVDCHDTQFLSGYKTEIDKKAALITDPQERARYVSSEIGRVMQKYDETKQQYGTSFVLAGYDKSHQRFRAFNIGPYSYSEIFLSHQEIGSGVDGSDLYLAQKLQGVDSTKLSVAELVLEGVNAYSTSTVNTGVGGTPKIAHITKDGCKILPTHYTIAMVNLSGLSLSGREGLGRAQMLDHFHSLLEGQLDLEALARSLGLTESTLTNLCIPLSTWQEAENRNIPRER